MVRMIWMSVAVATLTMAALAADEAKLEPAKLVVPRNGLGNVLAKLDAGKDVTVAYFGGSITAANGWRSKTTAWLKEAWPQATIHEVHAAIGGTPSMLGAFRLQHDVLDHKPDLVFVEFSVNDGSTQNETIYRAMEGIVRQIWTADPTIDICYVYTFRVGYENQLRDGLCPHAPSAHEVVANHYGIPSINWALRVTEIEQAGKLIFKGDPKNPPAPDVLVFSADGVHPLDGGHEIYLAVTKEVLPTIRAASKAGPHAMPEPIMADNWQAAKMVEVKESMLGGQWTKLPADHGFVKSFGNRTMQMWEATTPGATIEFRFKGTTCQLYDLLGPDGGNVKVTIDGQEKGPYARFDSYCTYHRLATLGIASGLEDTVHTVKVELLDTQPDRSSVTDREKDKPGFNPAKYDGTGLRVGGILMIGELVE